MLRTLWPAYMARRRPRRLAGDVAARGEPSVHMNRLCPEYNTIEFESYPNGGAPEQDSVDVLMSWCLSEERFDGAVARIGSGLVRRVTWPCVVLSLAEAHAHRSLLLRTAQTGFSLVVAVRATVEEFVSFSTGAGLSSSGRGRFRGGGEHDPFSVAGDQLALEELVYIGSRLSDKILCVFAHDADPVYVLHR